MHRVESRTAVLFLLPALLFILIACLGRKPGATSVPAGSAPASNGQATAPLSVQARGAAAFSLTDWMEQLAAEYTRSRPGRLSLSLIPDTPYGATQRLARRDVGLAAVHDLSADYPALSKEESYRAVPLAAWAAGIAYRLDGLEGQLALDGQTLADIYLGRIQRWSDPRLALLNPELKLPDKPIVVTYWPTSNSVNLLLTRYLSKNSVDWRRQVGEGLTVKWPCGVGGGRGAGVETIVRATEGSIGVVVYGADSSDGLSIVALVNKRGRSVSPDAVSIAAAVTDADLAKNPRSAAIDRDGDLAYPLVAVAGVFVAARDSRDSTARAIDAFLMWALSDDWDPSSKSLMRLPSELRRKFGTSATHRHGDSAPHLNSRAFAY